MAAVPDQQISTFAQGRSEIETHDAATRASPVLAFASDDDCRTIKLLGQAGCHNARNADVPERLAFHDDEVQLRLEFCADCTQGFFRDALFESLPLTIL